MLVWDRVWVRRRLTVTCTLSCFVVREYLWLTHARALVARPSLCIFHILRLSEYWKAVFGWRGRQVRTVWTTGADNRSFSMYERRGAAKRHRRSHATPPVRAGSSGADAASILTEVAAISDVQAAPASGSAAHPSHTPPRPG